MSKLLVIFGATGQQGGSIANFVLNDPELSNEYRIRAITRDITKPSALALHVKGIEVVHGDPDDAASLDDALVGAQQEITQGKTIADKAVAAGAQYLIYSTVPSIAEITGAKYMNVTNFESKAQTESYIRQLPI